MIFSVAIVIVDVEASLDPQLDAWTPIIRDIFDKNAHDQDSFDILTVERVPHIVEEISGVVRDLMQRNTVDLILVTGGIGFEENDCTPEASGLFTFHETS